MQRIKPNCHRSSPWGVAVLVLFLVGVGVGRAVAEPIRLVGEPERAALEAGQRYIRTYQPLKDWRGQPMRYWVTLPAEYDPEKKYPILLEWPGKGGGPHTQVFRKLYGVTDHVHVGLAYPKASRNGSAMLYATEPYTKFIRHVYDDVVSHFGGDPDYVFIGGFSAGGFMATGPGISLMIRAGLRDKLAGVLAGGCNWMCDPRYVHEVNVLLWYSAEDPNSSDLARRLPELREYAGDLKVIKREGAEHACKPKIEGPAIRRFLAEHGPNGRRDKVAGARKPSSNSSSQANMEK